MYRKVKLFLFYFINSSRVLIKNLWSRFCFLINKISIDMLRNNLNIHILLIFIFIFYFNFYSVTYCVSGNLKDTFDNAINLLNNLGVDKENLGLPENYKDLNFRVKADLKILKTLNISLNNHLADYLRDFGNTELADKIQDKTILRPTIIRELIPVTLEIKSQIMGVEPNNLNSAPLGISTEVYSEYVLRAEKKYDEITTRDLLKYQQDKNEYLIEKESDINLDFYNWGNKKQKRN